jgi:SAM-dependent methyltransferase
MKQQNTYTDSMCENYDKFMEAGYYNHDQIIKALLPILQGKNDILELGIGTGLLAERLANKGFNVSGIDHTQKMIDICKRKGLEKKIKLEQQNVLTLNLENSFDAAVGEGGIWYFEKTNKDIYLNSHLTNYWDNLKALSNVRHHLNDEGLLILSIQPAHKNKTLSLKNQETYKQKVEFIRDNLGYIIEKDYLFLDKKGKQKGYQHCTLRRFNKYLEKKLIQEANLKKICLDPSKQFVIFQKN